MICTEVAEMYEFVKKVISGRGGGNPGGAVLSPLCGERAVRLPEIVDIYGNPLWRT